MKKTSEYKLKWKKRKKEKALLALGGKCIKCGYDKCMDALDFHHLQDTDKHFNISNAICRWKWETIKIELEKCVLLCANCHREHHSKHVDDFKLLTFIREWIVKECPTCNKKFDTRNENQIFCSSTCSRFSTRKTKHPSSEELEKLIKDEKITWTQMGKMFGVSDNAVRKWAKKYNLIES